MLPASRGVGMNCQKSAAAVVASRKRSEGPNVKHGSRKADLDARRRSRSIRKYGQNGGRRAEPALHWCRVLHGGCWSAETGGDAKESLPSLKSCFMNRRIPNGPSGGVAARRKQSRLLPDRRRTIAMRRRARNRAKLKENARSVSLRTPREAKGRI